MTRRRRATTRALLLLAVLLMVDGATGGRSLLLAASSARRRLKFARVARGAGDDDDPVSDDEQHEYTAHAASSASATDCFSPPVPTFHYSEDEDVCENYLGEAVHRACYVCAVEPEIETEIAAEPEIEVEIEDEVDAEIEAEAEVEVPEHAVPCAARLRQAFVYIMHGLAQGIIAGALDLRHETAEFAHEADALAWDVAEARVLDQALSDRADSALEQLADVPDPRELELPIDIGVAATTVEAKIEIEIEIGAKAWDATEARVLGQALSDCADSELEWMADVPHLPEVVPHPPLELPIDIDIAAVEAEIEIEIEAKIGIEIEIEAKAP